MLSRDTPQLSPFTTEGLSQPTWQSPQPDPIIPPERNRGRGFRRAGNACEVAAGASLNSAIIFLFHLLQVHPLGLLVALGCSHFYFVATAFGEGRDRLVGNAMTGASAGVAGLSALSEPLGEWLEAKQSQDAATQRLQELYSPQTPVLSGDAVLLLLGITSVVLMAIATQGKSRTRR